MNIVILNGSHRIGGNTYRFSRYSKEILDKKHQVTIFDLIENDIKLCKGCLNCEDGETCSLVDDYSDKIKPMMQSSDLIIFATPVYFNMPSAAMVNLIDRTNDLCSFFSENPKKALTFMVGQTDKETIEDAYKCLQTYYEIMAINEIREPIINVARMPEDLDLEIKRILLSL